MCLHAYHTAVILKLQEKVKETEDDEGEKGENKLKHNPAHPEITLVNVWCVFLKIFPHNMCDRTPGCVGAKYLHLESTTGCFRY